MTSALDSFRNADLNPLGPGEEFFPSVPDISNTTGHIAPCGFFPDVWGNTAYFNQLCLPFGALSQALLSASFAQSSYTTGQTIAPGTLATILQPWVAGENSSQTIFLPVLSGIQVTVTATFMVMLDVNWLNVPGPDGTETWRSVTLMQNGGPVAEDAMPANARSTRVVTFNFGFNKGDVIGCGVSHDGSVGFAAPNVIMRVDLLGIGA